MPSPDACAINIKCHEHERDEVRRLAKLQGLTIQRYALKRLLMPWVDRDLADLGFGLILKELRYKGYPDSYVKVLTGELLRLVIEAPFYSEEFRKRMEYQRDWLRNEEYKRKFAEMSEQ